MKKSKSGGSSGGVLKEQLLRNAITEGKELNDKFGGSQSQEKAIIVQVVMIVVQFVEDAEGRLLRLEVSITEAVATIEGVSQF